MAKKKKKAAPDLELNQFAALYNIIQESLDLLGKNQHCPGAVRNIQSELSNVCLDKRVQWAQQLEVEIR